MASGAASRSFTSLEGDAHTKVMALYQHAENALELVGKDVRPFAARKCYVNGDRAYIPFTGVVEVNATRASEHVRQVVDPSAEIVFQIAQGTGVLSIDVPQLFVNGSARPGDASLAQAGPPFDVRKFLVLMAWIVVVGAVLVYMYAPSTMASASSTSYDGSRYPRRH